MENLARIWSLKVQFVISFEAWKPLFQAIKRSCASGVNTNSAVSCTATWANKLTEATVKNRIQLAVSFSCDVQPLFVWSMSLILNMKKKIFKWYVTFESWTTVILILLMKVQYKRNDMHPFPL